MVTHRYFGLTARAANRARMPAKPTSILFMLFRLLPARSKRRASKSAVPTTAGRSPAVPSFLPFDA